MIGLDAMYASHHGECFEIGASAKVVIVCTAADHSGDDPEDARQGATLNPLGYHPAPFVAVFTRQRYMSAQM